MMTRALVLLLALLASLPAAAQQVPNPMSKDGTNAQMPQAADELGIQLNIKHFGATGDGASHPATAAQQATCPETPAPVSSDTCALQAAINHLKASATYPQPTQVAATGGTVFVPSGRYVMDRAIKANDVSVVLQGGGVTASILTWGAGLNGFEWNQTSHRSLVSTPTVIAGGIGYANGNLLTVTGGTCTTQPVLTATVSAGAVTGFTTSNPGDCSIIPPNTETALSGGSGTGATARISSSQWGAAGGSLSMRDLTINGTATGTAVKASFGFSLTTGNYENVTFGSWGQTLNLTNPSLWNMSRVIFGGNMTPDSVGVDIFAPQSGLGHYQYSFVDSYCTKYSICYQLHMQGGPANIQGVMWTRNQGVNINDFVKVVGDPGVTGTPPQWMFTDNQTQQNGWFFNSVYPTGAVFAQNNLLYMGNGLAGLTIPSTGGGFSFPNGVNGVTLVGNFFNTLITAVPNLYFVKAGSGSGGVVALNAMGDLAGGSTTTFMELGVGSVGWTTPGGNAVGGGVTNNIVNNGTSTLGVPQYASILGVGVSSPTYQIDVARGASQATGRLVAGTATALAGQLILGKTRNNNVSLQTAVQNNDAVFETLYQGSDGAAMKNLGMIRSSVNGTVGTNIVPGKLSFYTANSAGTLVSGLEIDAAQQVAMPNIPTTGTATGSLCIDSVGKIFKKTTAGPCL
jgi:hypothetical protein